MIRPSVHRTLPAILLGFITSGFLAMPSALASTRVGGTLETDTVWSREGSPYVVYRDVYIPENITLTIEAGADVMIKARITDYEGDTGTFEILVDGRLVTQGTAEARVHFQSAAVEPTWADWAGIIVKETGSAVITNAVIHHASQGVYVYRGSAELKSVDIENADLAGVYVNEGYALLDNVTMGSIGNKSGTGKGIMVRGGELEVKNSFIVGVQNGLTALQDSKIRLRHSVVSHCITYGMWLGQGEADIQYCSITGNNYGIILTGDAAPRIKNNNLFQNGVADVQVRMPGPSAPTQLDLSGNWWEYMDIAYIEERVIHSADNPALNLYLNLEPFLQEAVSTDASRP